ncbi:MAG: GWxTD domain-containing protein [Candidatus Kapabacteria bacterium]|nr:GWxTD domain-containing protein [Candidatus Kapabacteria bacterium]
MRPYVRIAAASAVALVGGAASLLGQTSLPSTFVVDAISTRSSEIDPRARLDIYTALPYEALQFESTADTYVAKYSVSVTVRDSTSRIVIDTVYERSIAEKDYRTSRGATGSADRSVRTFRLAPGRYRLESTAKDIFSRREYQTQRDVTIPDYTTSIPSISSILYLDQIEQRGDRFKISPYIGDVIHAPDMSLFAFFETYVDAPVRTGYSWRVSTSDGRVLAEGITQPDSLPKRSNQQFIPIALPAQPMSGSYTLRIRMHDVKGAEVDTSNALAERTRGLTIPRTALSEALSDLGKAIKQLRYVAQQADIDQIETGASPSERQARFEAFWKTLDPTPNTIRNEAFEEYYARIEHANKNYRAYTEGWLTDMGMVYIILGPPAAVERFNIRTGFAQRIVWTYPNNFSYIFDDNTGFGDYRLRTLLPPGLKYRYQP